MRAGAVTLHLRPTKKHVAMSRFQPSVLLFCAAFATATSAPSLAQIPEVHLSAQESVELHRLLAEEDSAIQELPDGQQYPAIFSLARHYWLIGDRAATRAQIDRAKDLIFSVGGGKNQSQATTPDRQSALGNFPTELRMFDFATRIVGLGDVDDASEILRGVPESGRMDSVFSMLAIKLAQAGESDLAVQSALKVTEINHRRTVFVQITGKQIDRHDFSGALNTISQMNASPEKADALMMVVHAELTSGDRVAALESAKQAVQIATELPKDLPHGSPRFSFGHRCAPGSGGSMHDTALQYAAQAEWDLGDHEKANALQQEISEPALRDEVTADFVGVDARSRNFAEAMTLLAKVSSTVCRDAARRDLAVSEYESGDVQDSVITATSIENLGEQHQLWFQLALDAAKYKDLQSAELFFSKTRETLSAGSDKWAQAETLALVASSEREAVMTEAASKDSADAVRFAQSLTPADRPMGMSTAWLPDPDKMQIQELALNQKDFAAGRARALALQGQNRSEAIETVSFAEAQFGDIHGGEAWALSLHSQDRVDALEGVASGFLQILLQRERAGDLTQPY